MKQKTESINLQQTRMAYRLLINSKYGMGQYYHPINEDKMEHLYSHDYDNGLKLMEHSWMGNNFVRTVEHLLSPGQPWHKCRLTWSGDYGDRTGELYPENDKGKIKPLISEHDYKYILNHDKKMFVDKENTTGFTPQWINDSERNDEWKIHPLPLLTADGNGRGGGDYYGYDPDDIVGSWAGDRISVSDLAPEEDWEELIFNLVE